MKLGLRRFREIKEKKGEFKKWGNFRILFKGGLCRLIGSRNIEEGSVLYYILDFGCLELIMNDNEFFLLMVYLYLCVLLNVMGKMKRLCFCVLFLGVVELWGS